VSSITVLNIVLLILVVLAQVFLFFYHKRQKRIYDEEKLQVSRLTTILESGEVTLWTYDVDARTFTRYNRDMTSETESLKEVESRMDKADFNNLMASMSIVRNGIEERSSFVQNASSQHNVQESELVISPLVRQNGEIKVLMAVQHDMTKERRQYFQLDEAKKRFQAIFDESPFDLYIYDSEGWYVNMNNQARETFAGRKKLPLPDERHNLKDIPFFQDIDINDGLSHNMAIRIAFSEDGECTYEYAVSARRELRMYYETAFIPIYNDNGERIYTVVRGIDVTDLAMGYHDMKADNKRLGEATKTTMALVEKIDYVLTTFEMQILCFYPDTRQMVFYKSMGVVQHVLDEIQLFTQAKPDTYPHFIRELQVVNKRLDQPIRFHIHSIYQNKDGSERYLNCTMNPVFRDKKDGSGKEVDYYFGAMTNDSQMVMTTMKLEEEKKKAEESETVETAFLKNMSYEIRSPLTNVVGFTELLEHASSEEEEKLFVSEIKNNSDKLLMLVNEVLLLSRLDANMEPLNIAEVNVPEAYDRWITEAWEKYGRDDLRMIFDSPYEHLVAELDAAKVDTVMDHLLMNAVAYTKKGYIHFHYEYVGGAIVLNIEDTGVGMDKETLDKIMERFARGSSNREGTGLGLPICQSLVKLMGGTMNIQSTLGKGTSIWVTIPCNVLVMTKKKKIYV